MYRFRRALAVALILTSIFIGVFTSHPLAMWIVVTFRIPITTAMTLIMGGCIGATLIAIFMLLILTDTSH